jgi:hypothetical protein
MDSQTISDVAEATLSGMIAFPEVLSKLVAEGVEYFHVDYVGRYKQFYDGAGGRVVTPIPYDDLPPVAAQLDVAALCANNPRQPAKGTEF